MVNLDDFNNLGALMTPSNTREAFNIDISLIDEDPEQPRTSENPGFSDESIEELAETVRARGIKSPISLRKTNDGRYIINHGARRYRAAIKAGLTQIPAFVDNDYSKLDQVIENIQRNNLTPNEIAAFIAEEISMGLKKVDIAKELGKSSAWVTQYCTLLELPTELEICWQVGVFGDDVTAVAELSKLYKKNQDRVLTFIANAEKITRKEVTNLKEIIDDPSIDPLFARAENYDRKSLNSKKNSEQSTSTSHSSNVEENSNRNSEADTNSSSNSSSTNTTSLNDNNDSYDDYENEDESNDEIGQFEEDDSQINSNSNFSIGPASKLLENFEPNNFGGLKLFNEIKCLYCDEEVFLMPIQMTNGKVVVKKIIEGSVYQELYFEVNLEDLELKEILLK